MILINKIKIGTCKATVIPVLVKLQADDQGQLWFKRISSAGWAMGGR